MTATYGAIARTAYGSRTNITTSVPASTADGDLLILLAITVAATSVSVSLPAGFTAMGSAQTGVDDGGLDWYAVMGYRVASSEPANYTCTHASAESESLMIRVDGSGTLSVDAFSQGTQTGTGGATSTAPSVTPTAADDLLLYVGMNWNASAYPTPTGMTERQDSEFIYLADQALASSSATGTRTQNHGVEPWFSNLIAIKDAVGGGTTLTAAGGSYTITGAGAGLLGKAVADGGSYALTGYVATFAYKQTAAAGSYSLSGTAAGLNATANLVFSAAGGAYTLTGSTAGINVGGNVSFTATAGAYTLTGSDAAFFAPVTLTAAGGTYTLTGTAATFQIVGADITLFCDPGSYTLSGTAASFPGYEPITPPVQPSPGSGYAGAWSGPKRRKRKRDEIEELIDAVIQAPPIVRQTPLSEPQPPPPALIDMTAKMQAVGLTPPQRKIVKRAIVTDDPDDDDEAIELLLNLLS